MTTSRLDGRVAVVTGAGRGIGRAIARCLAAQGCSVVVNDAGVTWNGEQSSERPADQVVAQIRTDGGEAIADGHSVVGGGDAIVRTALAAFGRVDIVVNNAGITTVGPLTETGRDQFARVLDTHLTGSVDVIRAAWPHLATSGTGRIVNMSSDAAYGSPLNSAYASAKAALLGLTRTLALDGAAAGIKVNAVIPIGYSRLHAVNANEASRTMFRDKFPPEMVASFVGWLAHPSMTASGEAFSVGGGRVARMVMAEPPGIVIDNWSPKAWAERMAEVMRVEPDQLFLVPHSNAKRTWLLTDLLHLMTPNELTASDAESVTFSAPDAATVARVEG